MPKPLKYALRILAALLLLWLLVGVGAWIYFRTHRKELTARANTFLNERFRGTIHIDDIGINFLDNFPYPALRVSGVTIDDSVYALKGIHTLSLERVVVIPGFKGLFSGKPSIRKVVLAGGSLYLYRDSSGYYNGYVWTTESQAASTKKTQAQSLPVEIQLENVNLTIADSTRYKSYGFQVHYLSMVQGLNGWKTRLNVIVQSLAFNTHKGSFLKDQEVRGDGFLDYAADQKTLSFRDMALTIAGQQLKAEGSFQFDTVGLFHLHIGGGALDFPSARVWLPPKISHKLDSLSFKQPIAVDARISGRLVHGGEPHIRVDWAVRHNTVSGYIGTVYDCSFTGYFINTVDSMQAPSDANSVICADSLDGKYENSVAFHTRRLEIDRLDTAMLVFDLGVHNDVAPWADLVQSEDFSFDKGKVDLDLRCKYPLTDSSGLSPDVMGTIRIRDAEITYIPRNVKIRDGQVEVAFNHKDLLIHRISGKIGESPVNISGSALDFLALGATDASRMVLDWKVSSPSLSLEALLPFLGKGGGGRKASGHSFSPGHIIDHYFRRCSINTQLSVDRLSYRNFLATGIDARLRLDKSGVSLPSTSFRTAGGSISLSGMISNSGDDENPVKLNAVLTHLDLSTLFRAFDDFGQESLTSRNISGVLDARANLSLALTNRGKKVPGSLNGTLSFSVDKGALLNFSPLTGLSNFALKHRDLSHVYFSQLHDNFTFSRDTLAFDQMEIQSSVLEMFAQGVYKLDGTYTNADIQVPLSNIKRRKGTPENVGVDTKHGLSIYVHAYNTGNEKLHYKLGLFKKKTNP